ncbi:MAG: protein kinase [Pseudomonadota bacterium]
MAAGDGPQFSECDRCGKEIPAEALFCSMCGASRTQRDGDPMLGEVIAERYLLRERLGHGGSGTVYLADHITIRRKVAVKLLHHELSRDDLAMERFRREATTVGAIDNDHIVQVLDFGKTSDNRLFLVMEYLQGEVLSDVLLREQKLQVAKVVDVLTQLGEALMEAHAMGYVHRDLRPRNVFLARRRDRDGFVKLLDFGLAKLVEKSGDAASTSLGMTFGDPRYMSPEQARGQPVDRRADIYSLGVIGYEMLAGEPPFVGKKVLETLTRQIDETPRPPSTKRSDTPPWLEAVLMRALAKQPDDRFITVYRFVEAIRQGQATGEIMGHEAACSMPAVLPPPPAPRPRAEDAGRTPSGGVLGLSGAWYAEGDLLALPDGAAEVVPPKAAAVLQSHRAFQQSDSVSYMEHKPQRRIIPVLIGVVAGALVAAIVSALLWPRVPAKQAEPASAPPLSDGSQTTILSGFLGQTAPSSLTPAALDAGKAVLPAGSSEGSQVRGALLPEAGAAPQGAGKRPDLEGLPLPLPPSPSLHPLSPQPQPQPQPQPTTGSSAPSADNGDEQDDTAPTGHSTSAEAASYVALGKEALRQGDVVAAANNFNKARMFDNRNAAAIAGLGQVALRQGYHEDAIVHLEQACRLSPGSAWMQVLRGQAYLAAGKTKQAATAFKSALKLQPTNAAAQRGLQEATAPNGQ